jgi:hypothetical protein
MITRRCLPLVVEVLVALLAAGGCAHNEPVTPDPDPNAPVVFLGRVGSGISTRARFRLKNTTEETISYLSGVYPSEAWKDGQWQSGGALCRTGAPRLSLAPGAAVAFEVPWSDAPNLPSRRVGVTVWRGQQKVSETLWSDAVPPLLD